MHNPGRGEGGVACRQPFGVIAYLKLTLAFHHNVQLVLAPVSVGRVLLPRFESVQPCEEEFTLGEGTFAHFLGPKLRTPCDVFKEHTGNCSSRIVKHAGCVRRDG